MDGKAYKRLVNNIVQSLKPASGKKPLGQLMLESKLLKKLPQTTNGDNWMQLELHLGKKRKKNILVTLANILRSY